MQITTEDKRLVRGEMDDGSGKGGDTGGTGNVHSLQPADGTGHCHCRRMPASHWSEAEHGGLSLADGA